MINVGVPWPRPLGGTASVVQRTLQGQEEADAPDTRHHLSWASLIARFCLVSQEVEPETEILQQVTHGRPAWGETREG